MILSLKNIGKIQNADIELNGITVIAGENDTGKTTVGKVLYSVCNCANFEENIDQQKREYIYLNISQIIKINGMGNLLSPDSTKAICNSLVKAIMNNQEKYQDKDKLINKVSTYIYKREGYRIDLEEVESIFDDIIYMLKIDNEDIFINVIENNFNIEMGSQINNKYTKKAGQIRLTVQNKPLVIDMKENNIQLNSALKSLDTDIIYIDSPFILDNLAVRYLKDSHILDDHRADLKYRLYTKKKQKSLSSADKILLDNKLNNIYEQLNSICDGSIKYSNLKYNYCKAKGKLRVDVRNISAGLKIFVILKTLLQNGWIEENGIMIFDEAEIYLQPEWQVIFAKLIVLLQKEFNMHILLLTQNPYFLKAIELYSAKYEVADKSKYYLAYVDGKMACLKDVSENTESIYAELVKPLQDLVIE